ncbi:MAG: hypothetical protein R3293_20365 [Candidatus Promineifilaceae bacterium]|nr:hypothetical protein [Candidatus Promineifilaceae bacterium]
MGHHLPAGDGCIEVPILSFLLDRSDVNGDDRATFGQHKANGSADETANETAKINAAAGIYMVVLVQLTWREPRGRVGGLWQTRPVLENQFEVGQGMLGVDYLLDWGEIRRLSRVSQENDL